MELFNLTGLKIDPDEHTISTPIKLYPDIPKLESLQDESYCAAWCEYISLTRGDLNCTWQAILIYDDYFLSSYPLEHYRQYASNFFGFRFVSKDLPISYPNTYYDCAWLLPNYHPKKVPMIDSEKTWGNSYMTNPKAEKLLHYFLNQWAIAVFNKAVPKIKSKD